MWPFRRKKEKKPRLVRRLVVGMVIGGAIGSVIGKKLMDERRLDAKRDAPPPEEDRG